MNHSNVKFKVTGCVFDVTGLGSSLQPSKPAPFSRDLLLLLLLLLQRWRWRLPAEGRRRGDPGGWIKCSPGPKRTYYEKQPHGEF